MFFDLIEDSNNCGKQNIEDKKCRKHDKKHGCRCHDRKHDHDDCRKKKHMCGCHDKKPHNDGWYDMKRDCRCHDKKQHHDDWQDKKHNCKCHDKNHHDDWEDKRHHCRCHHMNHDCNCHKEKFDCHDLLQVNFNGLRNDLNAKLLKNQDRPFEMVTAGGYRIRGKTHHIGIDYVDIERQDTIVTILKDKIDHILWNK